MRMASNTTEFDYNSTPENIVTNPLSQGASQDTGGTIGEDPSSGYFNVIIGAVIAVIVLVFLCLLLVLLRYMYKHKGTYHTNEAKGSEFADTADAALQGDPALQDTMDETKKEYFI